MSTVKLKCDTCKREIQTLEQKEGLNSFNKCIITKGCRGRLYKVSRNPYNVREFFPEPKETNISNFFPRSAFFEYKQELPSASWKITHRMGVYPSVTVYVESGNGTVFEPLTRDQYNIEIVGPDEIRLLFNTPRIGIVHCVARSTKEKTPLRSLEEEQLFQVSTNNILTFAVLGKITRNTINPSNSSTNSIFTCDPNTRISINISIKEPEREEIFCVEDISSHAAASSPWIDWDALSSRKRRDYCIKSVDLRNFISIQEFYDDISDIPDGTRLKIISVNFGETFIEQNVKSRNLFMLLSDPPYNNVDKRKDILVDVGEVSSSRTNDSFVFIDGELFLPSTQIETIYPALEKTLPITETAPLDILSVSFSEQPFSGECTITSGSSCISSYELEPADVIITNGSGDYSYLWTTTFGMDIQNPTSATPILSYEGSAGSYTFFGQLNITDNITGQSAILQFQFNATNST